MKTAVVVTIDVEGIHRWAECPIDEVAFLRDYHRHTFRIRAEKFVGHDDREVEIIMLKRKVVEHLHYKFGNPCQFEGMSCEMIAKYLLQHFDLSRCEVLEDGENGAVVTI